MSLLTSSGRDGMWSITHILRMRPSGYRSTRPSVKTTVRVTRLHWSKSCLVHLQASILTLFFDRFFEDIYDCDVELYGNPANSSEVASSVNARPHDQVIIESLATKIRMEKVSALGVDEAPEAMASLDVGSHGGSDAEGEGEGVVADNDEP